MDALIARRKGDSRTVRTLLPTLESHLEESLTYAYDIACLYFFLNEVDKGFEWLERSYSRREMALSLRTKWDADLDGVRNDPRYLDLLKRAGLE